MGLREGAAGFRHWHRTLRERYLRPYVFIHINKTGGVTGFNGYVKDSLACLELPCDIMIPAAMEGVIFGYPSKIMRFPLRFHHL